MKYNYNIFSLKSESTDVNNYTIQLQSNLVLFFNQFFSQFLANLLFLTQLTL